MTELGGQHIEHRLSDGKKALRKWERKMKSGRAENAFPSLVIVI
jgi:hypothetical protein